MQELALPSLVPTPAPPRALLARTPAPSPARVEPAPATRVLPRRLGRYHLFAHIGKGGMADIHLAHAATELGGANRLVVIKEMLPSVAASGRFSDMLVSEAKLAARLSHANIVKVEDLGRVDDSLFIAMEYVEGLDLRELLRRCAKGGVALPVEFSLRIVIEALRGLSFAHRARDDEGRPLGIVHRDVSPSNVLLSFDGEVKLCDFGIARAHTVADGVGEDAIAGKAGYMSPEQARGEAVDARSDVFAAGIILWELCAGRRLYRAADRERLIDVARAAVIPPIPSRGLPHEAELHAIAQRALAEDRDARYPSAGAMLADLEEYAASSGMMASEIRFGAWLLDTFGKDVVDERRARERAMRAFARGPVAVIQAIDTPRATSAPAASALPEYECTPSSFMVAPRADPMPVPVPVPVPDLGPLASVPLDRPFPPLLVLACIAVAALVCLALRTVLVP